MYQFTTRLQLGSVHGLSRGHGATATLAQRRYLWFSAFSNFRKVGRFDVQKLKVLQQPLTP